MSKFFQNQIIAKRKTNQLIFLYLVAVLCIICAIYALFAFTLIVSTNVHKTQSNNFLDYLPFLWNPSLFLYVFLGVSLIIALASFFKSWQLGGSGSKVATMLNGRQLDLQTTSLTERRILNIVEEMAIASGMKVPPVFIMDNELGINAFAAGTQIDNAVIGISQGAIQLLNREELQGVVAHEFSHILNGDMRLNLRLIGVLFGILFIGITGRILLDSSLRSGRSRSRSSKDSGGGAIILVGVGLLIIGYTGVFFANLIKMAVSRQREYLADASAIEFTRNPQGIAGALKKIGGLKSGSRISNPHAEEVSHMFFASGIRKKFFNLFATHPPLQDRIKKIDPSFDGNFPQITLNSETQDLTPESSKQINILGTDFKKNSPLETILTNPTQNILNLVGTVSLQNLVAAQNLINNLPVNIYKALHNQHQAPLIIYSLILADDHDIKNKQLDLLNQNFTAEERNSFDNLLESIKSIDKVNFLPVLDLALPALNLLNQESFQKLLDLIRSIALIDQKIDLHEFTLEVILLKNYRQKFDPNSKQKRGERNLAKLVQPASNLFLSLAVLGNRGDLDLAKSAYETAVKHCAIPSEFQHNFQRLPEINFELLSSAILLLSEADYQIREILLRACIACISSDKQITISEFSLIRAIADSFDCPLPYLTPTI